MEENQIKKLIRAATEARKNAYCPYSGFAVGAALLAGDGKVFSGCNIENAAFSPGVCAERAAFVKAVSGGARKFSAICVTGGKSGAAHAVMTAPAAMAAPADIITPCGVCRQVMAEFCGGDFIVICAKSEREYKVYTLDELLPHGFGNGILNI